MGNKFGELMRGFLRGKVCLHICDLIYLLVCWEYLDFSTSFYVLPFMPGLV